jgi:hypothetical protein
LNGGRKKDGEKNTMRPATNDAKAHKFMQIIERKCEAQKGAGIRSNLNFDVVLWTIGEKHSINSPISMEIVTPGF